MLACGSGLLVRFFVPCAMRRSIWAYDETGADVSPSTTYEKCKALSLRAAVTAFRCHCVPPSRRLTILCGWY